MKSHPPRYSIRKYAVGAVSVLLGFFAGTQTVAADSATVAESPVESLASQPEEVRESQPVTALVSEATTQPEANVHRNLAPAPVTASTPASEISPSELDSLIRDAGPTWRACPP